MNRIFTMLIRQLMNVGIRKGMQMATKGGQKKPRAGQPPVKTNADLKRNAKITNRTIR